MVPVTSLEDDDFVDDLALVSHAHQDMQEKTDRTGTEAGYLGLGSEPTEVQGHEIKCKVSGICYFQAT